MPCGFDINRTKEEILKADVDYSNILKDKKKFIVDGNKYFNSSTRPPIFSKVQEYWQILFILISFLQNKI